MRFAYVLHDQRLVIFFSYKVGSSSIADALLDLEGHERDAGKQRRGRAKQLLKAEGYQVPCQEAERLVREEGYHSIALIREPYDRLVSAFLEKFVIRRDLPIRTWIDLEKQTRRFFWKPRVRRCLPGQDIAERWENMTFRSFAETVCTVIEGTRPGKEPRLDRHFSTQVPLGFYRSGFQYGGLYRLSNSDGFFAEWSRIAGRSIENRKRRTAAANAAERPEPTRDDLTDVRCPALAGRAGTFDKSNFQDEALKQRVRQAYQADYAYFDKAS